TPDSLAAPEAASDPRLVREGETLSWSADRE
ncbi:MAG: hypothetical protein ACI8RZ_004550, partial [Myxococcota bacterium]